MIEARSSNADLRCVASERTPAPAEPREALGLPVAARHRMKDAAVERRGFELIAMPAHEGGVGLVPAELDELLLDARLRRLRFPRLNCAFLAGEILAIPRLERRKIGRHQVDLAADRLRLARLEPADAEVGMEADDHTLKELLVRLPGGGDELLAVGRDAADQAVRGNDRRERPRVDIVAADARGTPDLAGSVKGLLRPRLDRHPDGLAIDVDETVREVSLAVVLELGAGIAIDANAGLCPVRERRGGCGVSGDDLKVDLIAAGSDLVVDHDAVFQARPQLDRAAVRVAGETSSVLCGMTVLDQSRAVEPGRQKASMYQISSAPPGRCLPRIVRISLSQESVSSRSACGGSARVRRAKRCRSAVAAREHRAAPSAVDQRSARPSYDSVA